MECRLHGRVFDCTTAVLIADGAGVADELAARLHAEGIRSLLLHANPQSSFDALLADVPLDRRTLIVFLAGLNSEASTWQGLDQCAAAPMFLQLAQAIQKREGVPRLFVVTNGAAGVAGDSHLDLGQAILHGMARVIKNECPNVPLTVIDLSASDSAARNRAALRRIAA